MLDVSEKQCDADSDCVARGLTNTSCVANLCRPNASSTGTAGVQSVAEAGSGGQDAGAAGKGGSASIETGGPDAVAMNAGSDAGGSSGTAGNSAAAAGKSGMSGGGSGGASGMSGAAGCSGAACGECSEDADCKERLGPEATCVDKACFGPPPQCKVDEDCLARGPEYMGGRCANQQCLPNPKWRCEPTPVGDPSAMVDMKLPIIDALQLSFVPNIQLVACSKLDYACDQPVAKATSAMDGTATFSVPANFSGYVQQNQNSGYGPGLYFVPTGVPPNGQLKNFPIFRNGSTLGLALALGAPLDPERGHMMLVAEDCMGNSLAGVAFSTPQADDKSKQFYVRDQTPTTSAMDTPPAGTGGFMNLPAGVAVISAKELKTGIELATVSVLIRAGYISMLYVRPTTRGTTMTGVGGH